MTDSSLTSRVAELEQELAATRRVAYARLDVLEWAARITDDRTAEYLRCAPVAHQSPPESGGFEGS
jgi:hypothetical protein